MRILDLEIDGFGVWSDLRLDDLSDRLTVLHGPNEAGKTTLLSFVRSILYGFSPARRQRYLPPVHGGQAGGRLRLVDADQELFVRRHWEGGEINGIERLTITDADGRMLAPGVLSDAMGNVEEPVFNNVFAIGLREIQELGAISDTDAARWLYGLSTGLEGVSLLEVIDELQASRDRLLPNDDKPSPIVQSMTARDRLRSEIDELRGMTGRYDGLSRERARIDAETSRLESEVARLERQVRVLEAANLVRSKWHERADLAAELQRLAPANGAADGSPANVVEKIDDLRRRLGRDARRRVETRQRWRQAAGEVKGLKVNRDLLRQAPKIAALAEQETWMDARRRQVEELELQAVDLEDQVAAEKARLGIRGGQTPDGHGIPDRVADVLRPAANAMKGPRVRLREASAAMQRAKATVDSLAAEVQRRMGDREEKDLPGAMERAGDSIAKIRRREQLDERIDKLGQHEASLAEQNRLLLGRQMLPVPFMLLTGTFFVIGCGLLLTAAAEAMGLPTWVAMAEGGSWQYVVMGLVFMGGSASGYLYHEHGIRTELEECQRHLGVVSKQLAEAREEHAELDRRLPGGGGAVRLQSAEDDMHALESLVEVDGRRHSAMRELDAATLRATQARDELQKSHRRWQEALEAAGLPNNLTPKQVQGARQSHARLEELTRRLDQTRRELEDRRKEFSALQQRVEHVLNEFDLEANDGSLEERLKFVRREISAQRDNLVRRRTLAAQARQQQRRYGQLSRSVKKLRRRRRALMLRAGARDEGELRRLAAEQARLAEIAVRRDGLSRDITAALGERFTEDELRPFIEGAESRKLEASCRDVADRIQERQDQLKVLYEGRGRLNEQLAVLAEDRQLPSKLFDLGVVERQLADAIRRWQVLALGHGVLERMRVLYETERQPETLREASDYLTRMTGGQYRRVWTPLTENLLFVEDAEGRSLPVEVLSRGSREQLFLSLRLALCALYARRGADLPLVLDDVLVNFDAQRTKAAATVLRDFAAEGRQVLVFTCHEHILKLFKSLKATTRLLPDNSQGRRTRVDVPALPEPEPAPPPARPARPRAKPRPVAPEPAPIAAAAEAERLAPETPPRVRGPLFATAIWHDPDDDFRSDLMLYDDEEDVPFDRPALGISTGPDDGPENSDDEQELDSAPDEDPAEVERLKLAEGDVEAA